MSHTGLRDTKSKLNQNINSKLLDCYSSSITFFRDIFRWYICVTYFPYGYPIFLAQCYDIMLFRYIFRYTFSLQTSHSKERHVWVNDSPQKNTHIFARRVMKFRLKISNVICGVGVHIYFCCCVYVCISGS